MQHKTKLVYTVRWLLYDAAVYIRKYMLYTLGRIVVKSPHLSSP